MTAISKKVTDRLCYLFLIFLTGCLVGWVYEEVFYWITEGLLRNRGILYGPWLPIYGIGALGIYAMKPVKKHPVLLFFLCAMVAGIVEYIIGYIGIRFFTITAKGKDGTVLTTRELHFDADKEKMYLTVTVDGQIVEDEAII